MRKISPSLLAANFANLEEDIRKIEKSVDYFHIDIMDGHFVPNISFGVDITKCIASITNKKLDIHLMIENPLEYIDAFLETNPEYITVHYETVDKDILKEIKEKLNEINVKLGLAISPDTPYEVIIPYLEEIDLILIMTVYPGFYGQKFLSEQVYKLDRIKEIIEEGKYNIKVEVDGGINNETIDCVKNADIIVSGSYILKSEKPTESIKILKK